MKELDLGTENLGNLVKRFSIPFYMIGQGLNGFIIVFYEYEHRK